MNHKIINEAFPVKLNGIDQWITIKGNDVCAPLMLVLHGGPGSQIMGYSHTYQKEWEKYFTVVNWDQRFTGRTASISGMKPDGEVHISDIVEDARQLTEFLLQRFSREKLIILGHSWGTVLGAILAVKYPELYLCYISTGTVVSDREQDECTIRRLREIFAGQGRTKDLGRLDALAAVPFEKWTMKEILGLNRMIISEGFSSVKVSKEKFGLFKYDIKPILTSPDYRLRDGLHLTSFKPYSKMIETELMRFDARELGLKYEMPVYFINGDNDYQTAWPVAEEFFRQITAPDKAWYLLKNCAHCWYNDAREEFSDVLCGQIRKRLAEAALM